MRYAGAAFVVVLLAACAVSAVLLLRNRADTIALTTLAEQSARERLDPELRGRAQSIAAHAADSVAGAVRAGDLSGIARRLQPFMDDPTVAALNVVASHSGKVLFDSQRATPTQSGTLSVEMSVPVRTLSESIPGAVTPETLATLTVVLEQAAPVPEVSLRGRLRAANAARTRLAWVLTLSLAGLGGLAAPALTLRLWRPMPRPGNPPIQSAPPLRPGECTPPPQVRRPRPP